MYVSLVNVDTIYMTEKKQTDVFRNSKYIYS